MYLVVVVDEVDDVDEVVLVVELVVEVVDEVVDVVDEPCGVRRGGRKGRRRRLLLGVSVICVTEVGHFRRVRLGGGFLPKIYSKVPHGATALGSTGRCPASSHLCRVTGDDYGELKNLAQGGWAV